MNNNSKRIILGVTGSIAAYKAAEIISKLKKKSYKISVVMTENAKKFISPLTLSCLSAEKIYSGMFEDNDSWQVPHINLAKDASLFLIAPATASMIGKIANGILDDMLSCLSVVVKCPVLIAPAMNNAMYASPAVQENCEKLKKRGFVFIEPIEGSLACGKKGKGHLAEVDTIIDAVEKNIK